MCLIFILLCRFQRGEIPHFLVCSQISEMCLLPAHDGAEKGLAPSSILRCQEQPNVGSIKPSLVDDSLFYFSRFVDPTAGNLWDANGSGSTSGREWSVGRVPSVLVSTIPNESVRKKMENALFVGCKAWIDLGMLWINQGIVSVVLWKCWNKGLGNLEINFPGCYLSTKSSKKSQFQGFKQK